LSFVSEVSEDGAYHDTFSNRPISTEPGDFGYFRKSVIKNAYTYSVGSYHRVAVSYLGFTNILPVLRSCSSFEICWQDVADGVDPIARSFSDDYVVIKRKLCVLDNVLVPDTGGRPQSAFENFWCFFDLVGSSQGITDLSSLRSARVSYYVSSYVASEHSRILITESHHDAMDFHVYCGLFEDPSVYLSYLDDGVSKTGFGKYPSSSVVSITFQDHSVSGSPTVFDVVSNGITVLTAPDSGDFLTKVIKGHEDLVYSFNNIQKLDDVSLAALSVKEAFQETDGARVKPFVDLCKEYRDYSDSEGSGSYDYAILLNDQQYKRSVVSHGSCWEGYYGNTSCHQIDSVRLLTLTFHNDLLGGDIAFSCVDTPVDTTVAHITNPYTIHVNGIVDNMASLWDKVLAALKIVLGVVAFVGVCYLLSLGIRFAFGLSSLKNGRRIKKLEASFKNSRRR